MLKLRAKGQQRPAKASLAHTFKFGGFEIFHWLAPVLSYPVLDLWSKQALSQCMCFFHFSSSGSNFFPLCHSSSDRAIGAVTGAVGLRASRNPCASTNHSSHLWRSLWPTLWMSARPLSLVAGAKSLEKYLSSSAASLPTFSHLPTTSHKVVQVSISSAVSQPSRASCFLMVKTITTHPSAPLSDAVSSPSVARPTGMVHACTSQFLNHSRGSYFATYVHEDHSIASLAIDDLLFAIFDRLILHRTDDR